MRLFSPYKFSIRVIYSNGACNVLYIQGLKNALAYAQAVINGKAPTGSVWYGPAKGKPVLLRLCRGVGATVVQQVVL